MHLHRPKKFDAQSIAACKRIEMGSMFLLMFAAIVSVAAEPDAQPKSSDQPNRSPEALRFFEANIRPLLIENCYKCHGGEQVKGGLRLDSRATILAGGESGPAIVPNRPDESLLVEAVEHRSLEMPPKKKLTDDEVATLREWIRIGAPWPDEPQTPAAKATATTRPGAGPALRPNRDQITDADRAYWAFQSVKTTEPPGIDSDNWSRGPIDRFVLARMQVEKQTTSSSTPLQPAPEADRSSLVRRLTFDLWGLPPAPADVATFEAECAAEAIGPGLAYERLVDRLLASPRYGEHWARHWLDLVRYAESDGYKQDGYRPHAWRYRDYVIRSLNADKPYDQFIREQIAGDELAPHNPDSIVATGYFRLGIYEYNQRDVRGQQATILNDITDVTSDVLLGIGLSCARCHDHKFDPLLQKDYYRLQAFFAPLIQRDDVPAATPDQCAEYATQLKAWEERTADIRRQIDEIERPHVSKVAADFREKFPVDIKPMLAKRANELEPLEKQIVQLAERQVIEEGGRVDFPKKLTGETKEKWEDLRRALSEFDGVRPAPLPQAMTVSDVSRTPPVVMIPGKRNAAVIEPGVPTVLDAHPLPIDTPADGTTTGRRTALAKWLTRDDNPLTARVMVNRVWQYHFGRGLVETASDFGRLGGPPSHPELLDYLSGQFVAGGWRLKSLHRQIVLSATYRQASRGSQAELSAAVDPANRLLARMPIRRLAAEEIRDAVLSVSGELTDPEHVGGQLFGGPGSEASSPRRTVYVKAMRNSRDSLLDVFDSPDGSASVPLRNVTTTPTQSLLMTNGPWMLERAKALAARLQRQIKTESSEQGGTSAQRERIELLYRLLYARMPNTNEVQRAQRFLAAEEGDRSWVALCHVLLDSNEFLYVD